MIRSVMEGATFAMRDSLEIIKDMGVSVRQIRVSGGGARSPFWRQLQADVYGHKVFTINAEEGPAYGVALLAMVGTGAYRKISQACDRAIHTVTETPPNRRDVRHYNKVYPVYRNLYESLKGDYKAMTDLV